MVRIFNFFAFWSKSVLIYGLLHHKFFGAIGARTPQMRDTGGPEVAFSWKCTLSEEIMQNRQYYIVSGITFWNYFLEVYSMNKFFVKG